MDALSLNFVWHCDHTQDNSSATTWFKMIVYKLVFVINIAKHCSLEYMLNLFSYCTFFFLFLFLFRIAIQWHNLQTVEVGHYLVEIEQQSIINCTLGVIKLCVILPVVLLDSHCISDNSTRFLCRPTAFLGLAGAVPRL